MTTSVTAASISPLRSRACVVGRDEVALHDAQHDRQRRGDGEGDEGEHPVVGQHHGGDHQHQRAVEQPGQPAPLEELGQRLDVARDPGDERAAPLLVVVGEAERWMWAISRARRSYSACSLRRPRRTTAVRWATPAIDEGDGGDRRAARRRSRRDAAVGVDALVDRLLQEDRHDDPAGRADRGEAPRERQALAQDRRLLRGRG